MAAKSNRFAAVEDDVRETLVEAATAPAGIRETGEARLAALQVSVEPEPTTAETGDTPAQEPAPITEDSFVVVDTDPLPTGTAGGGEEPKKATVPKPPAVKKPQPQQTAKTSKPAAAKTPVDRLTLPATPGWNLEQALDHSKPDCEIGRYAYAVPKGLLDRLRDLDLRARELNLATVSRRELATETARRIISDPATAIAIHAAYKWTKGGGQLQPIYSVELAGELDRTLARHKVRVSGPVIGVIVEQIADEIDMWLTELGAPPHE